MSVAGCHGTLSLVWRDGDQCWEKPGSRLLAELALLQILPLLPHQAKQPAGLGNTSSSSVFSDKLPLSLLTLMLSLYSASLLTLLWVQPPSSVSRIQSARGFQAAVPLTSL